MTVAMVPSITSARVTACNVGTSGMSVATVLGVGSTLVNVSTSTSGDITFEAIKTFTREGTTIVAALRVIPTVVRILGALVNVSTGITITMVPIITFAHAVYERCRGMKQVCVVVTITDGDTRGTVTVPTSVTCACVVTSNVVVTGSVIISTTVITVLTLVDIVARSTNQFVMWTVAGTTMILSFA
jgi:hypothetical protein